MTRNTNRYICCGETTSIFTANSKLILISTESIDLVKPFTWCVEGTGYAMSRTKGYAVKMHRLIMEAEQGQFVDHIDGNPLNNTLENLRLCYKQQNEFNTKIRSDNTSGYKGVSFHKPSGRYRAYINKDGIRQDLGLHDTKKDAAKSYNQKASELFGEFARLNQI
mgnify:FL=1